MADKVQLIELTADIISNYVANNRVGPADVAGAIQDIYAALAGLAQPQEEPEALRPEPAVSIRKSVQPDYLVNLFNGKKLKMLKRTLAAEHGMTPAEYRTYWGLPDSYPMVAPNYSESRRTLAKAIGLGRKPGVRAGKTSGAAAKPAPPARKPRRSPAARKPPTP